MKPEPSDALDAQLAAVPQDTGEPLDDHLLLQYRAGLLDEEQVAAVEARLANAPESRAVLAGLAQPIAAEQWARAASVLPTPRRSRLWLTAPLAAAAAAAVVLWLAPTSRGPDLPEYTLEGPFGGLKAVRSAEQSLVFGPESTLRVRLRPVAPVEGVTLGVYSGSPLRLLPNEGLTAGKDGAFVYEAKVGALLGEAYGPHTLHFVVGDPGGLAGLSFEAARSTAKRARWFSQRIEYRGNE